MHDILRVKISNSFTNIPKIFFNFLFSQSRLDFLIECTTFGVLKYHIGNLSFYIYMNIYKFNNFGMSKSTMHHHLILGDLIDLSYQCLYHFDCYNIACQYVLSKFDLSIGSKSYCDVIVLVILKYFKFPFYNH